MQLKRCIPKKLNCCDYCHKIIVPTNEAAKELNDLANYTGYCYYSHIIEAGTWIYEEKKNSTDGRFVKKA